ncbi:MAG: hypothetical protein KDB35_13315 [Acidimicrobiales bacterium]|nr:hypothetical protein [Acidimicrobiales bacterium]
MGDDGRRGRLTTTAALAAAMAMTVVLTFVAAGPAAPVEDTPEPPGVMLGTATNAGNATFSFTSDIPGAAAFDITTEHQQGFQEFDAPPGTYTVTQLPPPPPYAMTGAFGEGCTQTGPLSYEVVA